MANKTSMPCSDDLAWRMYTVMKIFIPIKFFSYWFSYQNTWKETLRLPEPWTETIATSYCIIWKRVNDNSEKCDECCYSVSSKKFSSVSFYVVYARKDIIGVHYRLFKPLRRKIVHLPKKLNIFFIITGPFWDSDLRGVLYRET